MYSIYIECLDSIEMRYETSTPIILILMGDSLVIAFIDAWLNTVDSRLFAVGDWSFEFDPRCLLRRNVAAGSSHSPGHPGGVHFDLLAWGGGGFQRLLGTNSICFIIWPFWLWTRWNYAVLSTSWSSSFLYQILVEYIEYSYWTCI